MFKVGPCKNGNFRLDIVINDSKSDLANKNDYLPRLINYPVAIGNMVLKPAHPHVYRSSLHASVSIVIS